MSRVSWDKVGERKYETGVSNVVLYPFNKTTKQYGDGVAWNGCTGVTENPEGAEPTDIWADNIKYLTLMSAENLKATIKAYMYPKEWEACDGSAELKPGITIGQQERQTFALCYQSILGNDTERNEYAKKYHFIYGCLASPSDVEHNTVNDSPEAAEMSWEISTTPVAVKDFKPTASLVVNTADLPEAKREAFVTALENAIYGTDPEGQEAGTEARILLPDDIKALYESIQ